MAPKLILKAGVFANKQKASQIGALQKVRQFHENTPNIKNVMEGSVHSLFSDDDYTCTRSQHSPRGQFGSDWRRDSAGTRLFGGKLHVCQSWADGSEVSKNKKP